MSHIRVLICRVDDPSTDQMTELAAFDLPGPDVAALQPATTLDDLETTTHATGNAILRRLLQAQWEAIDAQLTQQHRQRFSPAVIQADGHEPVTVASCFGTLQLSRQVCVHPDTQTHVMPSNAVLPAHNGMIITRSLQEWACLLPQELSFAAVARLLGWHTHEAQVLSDTTIRTIVRTHGQIIRQAEQAEVAALLQHDDLTAADLLVIPHNQPRRCAGWPEELNAAVDTALAAEQVCPPDGVSWADWDRVLAARRAQNTLPVENLRHLGPELEADQVLVTVDEVLTRKPEPHHYWELRTARVVTAEGYRYLSGVGERFMEQLLIMVVLALRGRSSLLLIADGALDPDVFYRYADPDSRQDHDSRLVPPPSEICRPLQSDL